MRLLRLANAVNGARAAADFKLKSIKFDYEDYVDQVIEFKFEDRIFQTKLPPYVRVTEGSVLEVLSRYCYQIEDGKAYRTTFIVIGDELIWFN